MISPKGFLSSALKVSGRILITIFPSPYQVFLKLRRLFDCFKFYLNLGIVFEKIEV